jgi:hypothetical protein
MSRGVISASPALSTFPGEVGPKGPLSRPGCPSGYLRTESSDRICAATDGRLTSIAAKLGCALVMRFSRPRCPNGRLRSHASWPLTPHVRAAFAPNERARSGELPAAGTAAMSRELWRAELADLRSRQGRAMGKARAERFRARRESRARELGYADLAAYLHTRYVLVGALVEDLTRELGASRSAVVADMDRTGISRRSRGEARARAHAARRKSRPA